MLKQIYNKFYQNDREITEEEYNSILASLPKPKAVNNEKLNKIAELKQELASYDYIGVKIAMGVATKEEYAKEIAHTEALRKQIRELED